MREYVCCVHTPYDYFDFNLKCQRRKLAEKLYFFVKFMYVTLCDLQGQHFCNHGYIFKKLFFPFFVRILLAII